MTTTRKDLLEVETTAFDMLRNDHKSINKFIEELADAPPEEKEGLLSQLDSLFAHHCDLEERIIYPRLRDFTQFSGLIGSVLAQNDEIRALMQQMENREMSEDEWDQSCAELKAEVAGHVQREEREMMLTAQDLLPAEEMVRVKELLETERKKAAQPHRHRDVSP